VRTRWSHVVGLLALLGVLGALRAEFRQGPVDEAGLWVVGLGTAAVLLAPVAARLPMAAAVAIVSGAALLLTGSPAHEWLSRGLACGLGALVAADLLRRGRAPDDPPALRDERDVGRLALAAATAGAAAGVVVLVGELVAGGTVGHAFEATAVIGPAHGVSHLLLVPFVLVLPRCHGDAGRPEQVAQAVLAAGVAVAVFAVDSRGVVTLLLPLLAWGALRFDVRHSLWTLVLLDLLAHRLTMVGYGPFAAAVQGGDDRAWVGSVLLQGYLASCAAIVLPLVVTTQLQRRRAREAAAERRRAERLVTSTVGTAIMATDLEGRIALANPGSVGLYGWSVEELVGSSLHVLLAPGELASQAHGLGVPADLATVLAHLALDPEGGRREWVVRHRDGSARAHLVGVAGLVDDDEAPSGYVVTAEDITDRIRVQEALIATLVTEHEAVRRLEEVEGVKDALVSTVSHELRTPITSILGYTEMLEEGEYGALTGPQLSAVTRVGQNSRRLLSLIDDLLTLSRLQSGALQLSRHPVDLRQVVLTAYDVVEAALAGRDLVVELDLPADPVVVEGDVEKLERLVANLLSNAVKFTPDGGSIEVVVLAGPDLLEPHVVEVRDTGLGIPEEEQEKLFSRFFRSSVAEERAIQGTGLGLSIVQAIAELHDGRVSATSAVGRGTTFRVELPPGTGTPEPLVLPDVAV